MKTPHKKLRKPTPTEASGMQSIEMEVDAIIWDLLGYTDTSNHQNARELEAALAYIKMAIDHATGAAQSDPPAGDKE